MSTGSSKPNLADVLEARLSGRHAFILLAEHRPPYSFAKDSASLLRKTRLSFVAWRCANYCPPCDHYIPMSDLSTTAAHSQKRRRITRACDRCSARSVKCRLQSTSTSRCDNCQDYDEECTFDRPMRKRGARSRDARTSPAVASDAGRSAGSPASATRQHDALHRPSDNATDESIKGKSWKPDTLPSQAIVMDLTEIYFEVVYPVFPFFHQPTLLRNVARGEYATSQPLFASVMALCALSSARVRDGALYTERWDTHSLQTPSCEYFLQLAADSIPSDAPLSQEFDYMRAYALLSIVSIQLGDLRKMNYYLCLYHGCIAVASLHDEQNWPKGIGFVEVEMRRRLFWSMYTLDVFSAIIWGGVVTSREACYSVTYPIECNDEAFSDTVAPEQAPSEASCWLRGWNFVTDLYRKLEHTVDSLGSLRNLALTPSATNAIEPSACVTGSAVLSNGTDLYNQLPPIFKDIQPITGRLNTDLFGFQAANIRATLQLVRMSVLATEHSTVIQKCEIAGEVIESFARTPVAYLRAISTPLLHHLAGIGTIMGSTFEEGLTESSYDRVRSVLIDLAHLLADLEVHLFAKAGTSDKLRCQVARIDAFMHVQRSMHTTGPQAEHSLDFSRAARSMDFMNGDKMLPIHFPADLFDDWDWIFDVT
ncbi:Zn(2)-C6 fungal-type domain-containing protein [Pseudozyma hubeiensis]|nr:Zn(2)-C6 fungal-type domain-containing protein [Pseudozyma hubeiensis]